MHTISDIFYGNITPPDHLNAYSDKRYASLSKQYTELTQTLSGQLSAGQMELHNQICNVQGQMESILSQMYFVEGFRDGAGIMLDVLTGTKGEQDGGK